MIAHEELRRPCEWPNRFVTRGRGARATFQPAIISPPLFMRIKRRLPVLVGFLLVVAALTLIVQLRKHAPPEAARLLPGADGFVYADLKWMRLADVAGTLPSVRHDPDYEQFIQATGFEFEHDLQEAAVAIHYASPASGPETRFSYVFVAKIDGDRFRTYLKGLSTLTDEYHSVAIYNIPLDGRTLRVAVLGVDTVAVSNHNDPAVIRGIIDRSRKLASPFGGPALLRQFYKHVPLTSLAWAVVRMNPKDQAAAGLVLPSPSAATLVASVRYRPLLGVHFQAEAFTRNEESAEQLTQQVNAFLQVFRSAEISVGGQASDPDMKKTIESLKVEQKNDRAVLTATVPPELIRKLMAAAPAEIGPKAQ
jgi:hypothetical protein